MTDIYWNYDINPLSDRAQFYLNTLKVTFLLFYRFKLIVSLIDLVDIL